MASGRRELSGFALEVIDFGHPWPMTLLCSLPFHQNLLLLRSKGNENRVVGTVVFLIETSRDPELKQLTTPSKVEKSSKQAEKKIQYEKELNFIFLVLLECLAAALGQ